jgi:uncharacterized protein
MAQQGEQPGKGKMTVGEAGRKGGRTVKEKYGPDFYSEIGEKGGEAVKEKYGPEFYSEIGQKGGSVRGQQIHEAAEYFKLHPEERPTGR